MYKMLLQIIERINTYLTDQANGMRYFPSLLQNCLLDFNTFCAHYKTKKEHKKNNELCHQCASNIYSTG